MINFLLRVLIVTCGFMTADIMSTLFMLVFQAASLVLQALIWVSLMVGRVVLLAIGLLIEHGHLIVKFGLCVLMGIFYAIMCPFYIIAYFRG